MTDIKKMLDEAYLIESEKQQQQQEAAQEKKRVEEQQRTASFLDDLRRAYPTIGAKVQNIENQLILDIDENHYVLFDPKEKNCRVISSHPIANPILSSWFSIDNLRDDRETTLLALIQDQIVEADAILTKKADCEIENRKREEIERAQHEVVSEKLQEMLAAIEEAAKRYREIAEKETYQTLWQWPEGKEVTLFKYTYCTGACHEETSEEPEFDYASVWSLTDPQSLPEKGFIQTIENKEKWINFSNPIDIERWVFTATDDLPHFYYLKRQFRQHSVVPGVVVNIPTTKSVMSYQDDIPVNLRQIIPSRTVQTVLPEDAKALRERFGDDLKISEVVPGGDNRLPGFYFEEPIDQIKEALS